MLKLIATLLFGVLIFPIVVEGQSVEVSVPTRIERLLDQETSAASPDFFVRPGTARFRYRLEGLDPIWQEKPDEMTFIIRFFREGNIFTEHFSFPVSGISSGWVGENGPPQFVKRRKEVSIPPDAKLVQIAFSSSGPPEAVGIYTIQGLRMTATGDRAAGVLLENGSAPRFPDVHWNKSGTRPSMALKGPNFPAQLKIVDTDITTHADWAGPALPVTGERLVVEWSEAYSIGDGGPREIGYVRLPPGNYRFQIEDLTIEGLPTGTITLLDFEVPRPLWQAWGFWLLCASVIAAVVLLLMRSAVKRKVRRAIRHTLLIENERLRIAMDLHDDIGTRLSQIFLISSHARMKAAGEDSQASFQQVSSLTKELSATLSETVWMLSPKNNDLESLIGFLCRLASELCLTANIRCRIDADPVDDDIPITQEFRHHIVLSVKEALNNAMKHSQGSEIRLEIKLFERQLHLSVTDNGIGLADSPDQHGNGLDSLRRRMDELGGTFSMNRPETGGLQILLEAPLKESEYQDP